MVEQPTCPLCNQSDQVEKVSTIYLLGIGLKRRTSGDPAVVEDVVTSPLIEALPSANLRNLSKRLSPPASRTQGFTRPIHPDIAVLAFSLITPIFLFGIYTSQRALLLPVLAILAVFYGVYIWQRKTMIARYERQIAERKSTEKRIQRGVQRWMNLYYCLRDDAVFVPGKKETIPADHLPGYLFKE